MSKTAKVILWIVAIGIVLYFGYKAYKNAHPTVTTPVIVPGGNVSTPASTTSGM